MQHHVLSTGWQVKARNPGSFIADDFRSEDDWLPATVPGTVHEALWNAGRIGDPYCAKEHPAAEWVGEREFLYRCRFDLPEPLFGALPTSLAELVCEGLDTVATVWLNGEELLRSDNMFVPASAQVTQLLRRHGNELWLRFEPALTVGREREKEHGQRPVWNGDNSRVYVRKAQYQYGWDFGPTLLGAGPWKPLRLEIFSSRIEEVRATMEVTSDLSSARIPVQIAARAVNPAEPLSATLTLLGPDGTEVHKSTLPLDGGRGTQEIDVARPALWWPHGHGEQPLYRLNIELRDARDMVQETRSLRLGARYVRLVQESLPDGEGFYFEINKRPIFCGGANWIPADLMPSRVSPARYRALLQEAVSSHMTMIRVWGGGIYEDDVFFDLCDELGILVWQDFMFACGLYPSYDELARSIADEATAAVRRLRHHASLVIWAGNNEDYSIAASVRAYKGPQEPLVDPGPSSLKQPIFDGRRLYEEVLSRVCAEHDPTRPYWPGSPFSRRAIDPNSPTEGDRHIWEIWHFPMMDYQDYGRVAGRFASEFGMQGVPSLPTVQRALGRTDVDEKSLVLINKGQDGPARIRHYIEKNLPLSSSLAIDDYIYATQLMQAEALGHALRAFRRQWDANRRCGGGLVWQFDDCWPGVSWSMLEFCDEGQAVRRKPSLYAARRELAPWSVGLAHGDGGIAAWAVTPAAFAGSARLRVRAFTLDGTLHETLESDVALNGNAAQELGELAFKKSASPLVYGAELEVNGATVARTVLWPQPLASLKFADPGLRLDRDGDTLIVSADRPVKGVLIEATEVLDWSDNLLDLLPGDKLTLRVPGLAGYKGTLQVRSLGGGQACF